MFRLRIILFCVTVCAHLPGLVTGHARLLNPPSRASKWRMGFSMPAADYDDNQGYCGGRSRLWNEFKGKCGVCGDAFYPIPRAHERGGRYYSGEITKTFKQGDIVEADVEVTANHRGWFEFKICPYDNPSPDDVERDRNGRFVEVTQRCLDKHPIPLVDGSGYRYELPSPWRRGIHTVKLRLPYNLVCNKCLFQWKYNTGNSWGKATNGSDCMGCGHQEQFYSCADVKITAGAHGRHLPPPPGDRASPPPPGKTWGPGEQSPQTPSFWTRLPGLPGWRQNPSYPTPTTSPPTRSTPRSRYWPWWFFDKEGGWFNRDVWATSTISPTQPPTAGWGDWTHRPQTTKVPFWNSWFLERSTKANPKNIPLVPEKKEVETKNKFIGFWDRLFSRARQNFWVWLLKGRKNGRTSRRRPKQTHRTTTTTTTTTTTSRPTTTTPWWKWWENDRRKTTTPAPKYRSWWSSWPWARVWDKPSKQKADKAKINTRTRPRWHSRSQRPRQTTTTTTTAPLSWEEAASWDDEHNNNYSMDDYSYNNNNNNNEHNHNEELTEERSSEVAQSLSGCYPVGIWSTLPGMKQWCLLNCAAGFCPNGYCSPGCKD